MTKHEFENTVIPFLRYYWDKDRYFTLYSASEIPIQIGNMMLFCSKSFIPDAILLFNENEIVDGFFVCGDHTWDGLLVEDIIRTKKLGHIDDFD